MPRPRHMVHLDADAFFASVEQASDARLRGKPVAVGGEKRGIIAAASYEARRFGVYTPMPTVRARKLCPKLIVLPGDFEKYEQFSKWMFSYVYDFTPDVEITSIDEGYFDLTGVRKPPAEVAMTIRTAIQQSLKITVSEGIGANKLISQIASKLNKPSAFAEVPFGREKSFLHPLPNYWLPGIGPQTAKRLNAAGLASVGQIAPTPMELLRMLLGKLAAPVKEFANGVDDRLVIPAAAPAKSYSHQQTFAEDQTDEEWIEAVLRGMADRLMASVRADRKSVRTVTVRVRYNDMDEDQRSESLREPTDLETDIYPKLRLMLRQAWRRRVSLRLVSLKLSNVYEALFAEELPLEQRARQQTARRRLADVVDDLRQRHGRAVILRGHDFVLKRMQEKRNGGLEDAKVGVHASACGQRGNDQPSESRSAIPAPAGRETGAADYIPLNARSYYSFLDSMLSVKDIVELAERHGLPAIAMADRNNLHGAVEFFQRTKKAGVKPVLGAEVSLGKESILLYVQNMKGYAHLCRILSAVHRLRAASASAPAKEGSPASGMVLAEASAPSWRTRDPLASLLERYSEGLIGVGSDLRFADYFSDRFYLSASNRKEVEFALAHPRWPAVASPLIRYRSRHDRWQYDIAQSIRTLTLLKQAHPEKDFDGAHHFRTPRQMRTLFQRCPRSLERTREIADRCEFDMPMGEIQFPPYSPPDGSSPKAFLRRLVQEGLKRRYGGRADGHRRQVEEELGIIGDVGYEEYFLFVWDILRDCRKAGIDWITRGSAADSLVCYCLGISDVCPIRFNLYFRRFLNKERMQLNKLPDIDIDFPHDRKDDVIDLIFEKFGPEHAAVVGGFSTFQARGAVGEIAKVLGVSERQIRALTKSFPHADARHVLELVRQRRECSDLPLDEEPYRTALRMAVILDGFPRYPKMHPCGVVLSRQPMHELTPTFVSNKGYSTAHFDMDAVEAIGLVKIDILAQGGLGVMRDVKAALRRRGIEVDLNRCRVEN